MSFTDSMSPDDAARLQAVPRANDDLWLALVARSSQEALGSVSPGGHVLSWNRGCERLFGCSREEAIGRDFLEFVPQRFREEAREHCSIVIKDKKSLSFQKTIATREGGERHVLVSTDPILDAADEVIAIAFGAHDISDRVTAENQLREREACFREIFEYAPFGMWLSALDGTILQVNPAACHMFGYSREELLGQRWMTLMHPDDLGAALRRRENLLESPRAHVRAEGRYIHRCGQVMLFRLEISLVRDGQDRPSYFVAQAEDITERQRALEIRRKAELELRESRAFTQATIDAMSSHICVVNESGEIVAVNRAWTEFACTNLAESTCGAHRVGVGSNYFAACERARGEEREEALQFLAGMRAVLRGEMGTYSSEYACHSPREQRWFIAKVTRFLSHGEVRAVIEHINITARKNAEASVRTSEELLRAITRSAHDAIVVMDEDGAVSYWNPAAEEIFGYSEREVFGKNLHQVLVPADQEHPPIPALTRFIQSGYGESVGKTRELSARRKDGRTVSVELSLSALSLRGKWLAIGILRDITGRKSAEAAREFALSLSTQIQEVSPYGMLAVDRNSMVVAFNDLFAKIWEIDMPRVSGGFPDSKVLEQVLDKVKDRKAFLSRIQQLYATDQTDDCELELKDGRTLERHTTSLRGSSDDVLGRVWFFRDVTERNRAAEELRESNRQLEETTQRANRLAEEAGKASAAKSEFLATISHEIRTPLNGLLGITALLEDTGLDERQRSYVEMLKSSGNALSVLINDVLDLSKIDAGRLELETTDFDPTGFINDFVRGSAVLAQSKGLGFRWSIGPDLPPTIRGDQWRLRQVLNNLVSNAVKFTLAGEVRVSVAATSADSSSVCLRFAVSDSGIGIPPDMLDAIFEEFRQVDASTARHYGGTGLGLAISRRLVRKMGGELAVQSQLDRGSEFYFTLKYDVPLSLDCSNAKGAPTSVVAEVGGRHILLAEDDYVNQQVALGLLKKLQCKVDLARNGSEALEHLQRRAYDVVLMDVQMPGMDGLEATARHRASNHALNRGVPILALSAAVLEEDRERCLRAGMNGFIRKPVSAEPLRVAIADALAAPIVLTKSDEPPAFDRSAMEVRFLHDEDLIREILDAFRQDAPARIAAIRGALDREDRLALAKEAHAFKGAAANVSAERLRAQLEEIETKICHGEASTLQAMIESLEASLAEFRTAVGNRRNVR